MKSDRTAVAARYRCAGNHVVAMAGQRRLVANVFTGGHRLLERDHVAVLEQCMETFRTTGEHADRIYAAIASEASRSRSDVASVIEELVAGRLLVSEDEIRQACHRSTTASHEGGAIATLAIPTRGRPDLLSRALTSLAENLRTHSREVELLVCDDTDDAAVLRQNRVNLQGVGKRFSLPARYVGIDEKRQLANALAQHTGVPQDVVDFALFIAGTPGAGANRNAIQLLTVGELVACIDDDMICRIASRPHDETALRICEDPQLEVLTLYADPEEAFAAVGFVEVDHLARHERLLGRTVDSCLAAWTAEVDVSGVDVHMHERLRRGASVALSVGGSVGDHGMNTSLAYFLRSSAERDVDYVDPERYPALLASRQVARVAQRHTLSSRIYAFGMDWAFDNRRTLPPFPPAGRAEDTAFARMLERYVPGAIKAALPSMMVHDPVPRRTFSLTEYLEDVGRVETREMLSWMVDEAPVYPGSAPTEPFAGLADYLEDLCSSSPAAFTDRIGILHLTNQCARLTFLDRAYDPDQPEPWHQDGHALFLAMREKALTSREVAPIEFLEGRTPAEATAAFRLFLSRFAALLRHWPVLREGVANLRAGSLQSLGRL